MFTALQQVFSYQCTGQEKEKTNLLYFLPARFATISWFESMCEERHGSAVQWCSFSGVGIWTLLLVCAKGQECDGGNCTQDTNNHLIPHRQHAEIATPTQQPERPPLRTLQSFVGFLFALCRQFCVPSKNKSLNKIRDIICKAARWHGG